MGAPENLPIEGHPDLAGIDLSVMISWYKTADAMAEATEHVTGYICNTIDDDFWKNHVSLIEQLEKLQPGTTEKIFTECEQVVQRRREIERQEERREARRQKIGNFVESLANLRFGL